MSYWKRSPGPHWSHFFQSLNPFASPQIGVLDSALAARPRLNGPPGCSSVVLNAEHAGRIAALLQSDYVKFPRARITLSEERIRQGFQLDAWIGVGAIADKDGSLIGCVISRPIGHLLFQFSDIPDAGHVDFFCVAKTWRKKGIASFLLQELTHATAVAGRLVHSFQHEGGLVPALPPVWQGRFVWRKRGLPNEGAQYLRRIDISERYPLQDIIHLRHLKEEHLRSRLHHMTGDSLLFLFQYRGFGFHICVTDTFHRSVPENWKIGEILWVLPHQATTPKLIQTFAIETFVDHAPFDILLMDSSYPHDGRKGWKKDAAFTWYLSNFNTGTYFGLQPYFIF